MLKKQPWSIGILSLSLILRFSPEEALSEHEKGSIYLPPPTWFMLHEMLRYTKVQDLIRAGESRHFGSIITPITPTFQAELQDPVPSIPTGRQFVSRIILPGSLFLLFFETK